MCACMSGPKQHVWRSDDGLQECMGSEAQIQVVRLGGKRHYLLSHLVGFCSDISYMPNPVWSPGDGKEEGHTYCTYLSDPARPRAVLKACHRSPSSQKDARRHDLISRWQMRSRADGIQQWAWELEYIAAESGLVCSWRLPQTHNSSGQGKTTVYNKFPKLAHRIRGRKKDAPSPKNWKRTDFS